MAGRYLAALFIMLLTLRCDITANIADSNLEILHLIETYGMRMIHKGKDYIELKKSLKWRVIELKDVRIYNLKTMYRSCPLVIQQLPQIVSMNPQWKNNTQCFSITWCIGFETIRGEAEMSVFATKFRQATLTILPLELQTQLKLCFPLVELLTQPEVNPSSYINSACDVAFSAEVQEVYFKKWEGVRLKGDGNFYKIVELLLDTKLFDKFIRKLIQEKMRDRLPKELAHFRQQICHKMFRHIKRFVERYAVKPS
ncbi:hypothetical protein Aperf_G00000049373 [Anoplocephala perfoliata]